MTDCPNAAMRDQLPDLVTERLSPADRVVVVAHVGQCAACTSEVEILRLARSVVIERTPVVNTASIVAALPAAGARRHTRGRSWTGWRIAATITVLAGGAGGLVVLQQGSTALAPFDSTASSAAIADSSAGLAMTGRLSDLDETELKALIEGLGAIDALPATEVEGERSLLPGPVGSAPSLPDPEGA